MFILEFTEQEIQALVGFIDNGLRSVGLRGAKDATILIEKIEIAMAKTKKTEE